MLAWKIIKPNSLEKIDFQIKWEYVPRKKLRKKGKSIRIK